MGPEQRHDACDCAPPDSPLQIAPRGASRLVLPRLTRRSALAMGLAGVFVGGAIAGPLLPAAFAADYPSWDDVEAARGNEAAKAAEITRIQGLIQSLTDDVARTKAAAEAASNEFYTAQQAYFDAAQRADSLQAQADEQAVTAKNAADKAGAVAAQLYRNGGDDTSLQLFFAGSADSADDLLARLGTMDQLLARNQNVYAQAITARDAAQSLSDQAGVARDERDRLQKVAEEKMVAAQQAADAAAAALAAQEQHLTELQAQLAALQDTTAKTLADYQAGVEAARKAAEEAAARAAAEAAARAAAAAAQPGGGAGGAVVGSGWARPSSGRKTSGYGPRNSVCTGSFCSSSFHYGLDLAAGCGSSNYAAQAGTVKYAGYNGGYGIYVKIDHGGGIATGYAHNGSLRVSVGQWVNAGQVIGYEGNTGNSLGCHLHFEVYVNGATVNPEPFLTSRGVTI